MEGDNSYALLYTALMEENKDIRLQALRDLIAAGNDVNKCFKNDSSWHIDSGATVLMKAAKYGYVECIEVLLEAGANVNQSDERGQTSVMKAVEAGADVNQSDSSTASNLAASNGQMECLKLLMEAGADVNQPDKYGETSLMAAAIYENIKCMRLLLEAGADVNLSDRSGETALLKIVVKEDCDNTCVSNRAVECVRVLLEAGADVNTSNEGGETALMSTSYWGWDELLPLLLEFGADVNQLDKSGQTALMSAASSYKDVNKCMRLLLEAGAGVNLSDCGGETALLRFAKRELDECESNCQVEGVQLLLKAGANVNQSDKKGETALLKFAKRELDECESNSQFELLSLLLEFGADVNLSDNDGVTALIEVARNENDAKCLKVLLDAGANVNHPDKEGQTALIHCLDSYRTCEYECEIITCLKLLVNAGADINAQNNRILQPIHYALSIRWLDSESKFLAEYLISENCNLSQASGDKVKAITTLRITSNFLFDVLKFLFACGLPRHLCQSYIVEQEQETFVIKNWIKTVASQPNTLQSICVFKMRGILGRGIKDKVPKLDLTSVCQDLILLKGILSPECFM